jgi:hypothetical protein
MQAAEAAAPAAAGQGRLSTTAGRPPETNQAHVVVLRGLAEEMTHIL